MKLSMQQVADRVGVSKMTISLYVKDSCTNRISEKVKKRIEEAMTELHYEAPGTMDAKNVVAVLLPFSMPIFKYELLDEYLSGIQKTLFENGYDLIFVNVDSKNGVPVVDKKTLLRCRSFQGVVLFGTRYTQQAELESSLKILKDNRIPAILLNYPTVLDNVLQGICVDDSACAPIDYLISLGHKRIAFMGGNMNSKHTQVLFDEYRNSLDEAGIEYDEKLTFSGAFEGYSAYKKLSEKLDAGVDFTALFCMSTQMVIGCYRALKEHGLRIPEDVSVINYGNPYFTEFLDPPLTAVSLPLFELGMECASRLVSLIDQGIYDIDCKILKQNTLVVRKSTAVNKH